MPRLALLVVALALVACEPTMYVPHPLPTPPMRPGTLASGEFEVSSRGTLDLTTRPSESLALHGRMYVLRASREGPDDAIDGGEVGATMRYDLEERTMDTAVRMLPAAELGLSTGRDRMASEGTRGITDRYAAHGGVVWSNPDRHAGVLLRVTSVSTHDVIRASGEPYRLGDRRATFLEPVVRFGHQNLRTEYSAQVGLSYPLAPEAYGYSYVPLILSARVGFRLGLPE